MTLLGDLEQQFSILSSEITTKIGKFANAEIGKFVKYCEVCKKIFLFLSQIVLVDDRRNLIIDINLKFDEAQELLDQIELEINQNTDKVQRSSQQNRLKSYAAELKRLEDTYNKSKIRPDSNSLLDDEDDIGDLDADQRRRLLDTSDRIERTGKNLQEGYRIAIETQETANQVLQDLSTQRETIQRSRNRLRDTNAELGRSSRVLGNMIMRSLRDKFALYGIGLAFVIIVLITIYFKAK